HANPAEMHTERINPEVIRKHGVATRDVPGNARVETMHRENPEAGCKPYLAVLPLVLLVRKDRRLGPFEAILRNRQLHLRFMLHRIRHAYLLNALFTSCRNRFWPADSRSTTRSSCARCASLLRAEPASAHSVRKILRPHVLSADTDAPSTRTRRQ